MSPHLERFLSRLEGVRATPSGYMACCPCAGHGDDGKGDGHPSLGITLGEDGRVLTHCFGGCMADAVLEAIGLDFSDLWPGTGDEDGTAETLPARPAPADPDGPPTAPPGPADADLVHRVYNALLGRLSLTAGHREALRARGLTDGQINGAGYRSLSFFALRQQVMPPLRQEFDEALLGVPGFVRKRGVVTAVELPDGLLIPVRAVGGRVVALKVRCDGKGHARYVWFSGGGGPSCGSPAHVPLGVEPADLVRVTEGPLKADIAFGFSGLPTIAVAGVSNWAPALPVLKELGAATVLLAFDADVVTKAGVARQLLRFAEALIAEGFGIRLERWPLHSGKGIDDLLARNGTTTVLTGDAAMVAVRSLAPGDCREDPTTGTPEPVAVGTGPTGEPPCPATGSKDAPDCEPAPTTTGRVSRTPSFPLAVFPGPVAVYAGQMAESIGCPVDYVAMSVLTAVATAIGDSRSLHLGGNWFESARLYSCIIGPPGAAKTPALAAAVEPVFRLQQQLEMDYEQQGQRTLTC
jgi:DNA primase